MWRHNDGDYTERMQCYLLRKFIGERMKPVDKGEEMVEET